ncbi:hypothetical protein DLM76_04190 [Leptospira yasudae]|nr:hypothetical protein DLM76_04190 [Leptospira yasudae]
MELKSIGTIVLIRTKSLKDGKITERKKDFSRWIGRSRRIAKFKARCSKKNKPNELRERFVFA